MGQCLFVCCNRKGLFTNAARGPDVAAPSAISAVRAAGLLERLAALGSQANRAGMARYGINVARAYGVPVAALRPLARDIGPDAALARALWATGVHEARILACLIHDPLGLAPGEAESLVRDIDSWDLCDQFTGKLMRRVPEARETARRWLGDEAAFVKRAGLSLLAALAVHDKAGPESGFLGDLEAVAAVAADARQPVRKAASWALRQIGKRGEALRRAALGAAARLLEGHPDAAWAARDAIAELQRL
jgi:3-methyladenine DNA glycosylase AlkD